ncbi:MAG: trigger factor [Candidatus Saccharimonadales bacterium]|nr:trigger factor [Candidatus Saccharimonadales bacterium]
MNIKVERNKSDKTIAELSIVADKKEIKDAKNRALKRLQPEVKVDGFRKGKVPLNVVEKNVDEKVLNTEALDEVVNELIIKAIQQENLKVLDKPAVEITKFVPNEELEFTAKLSVMAPAKIADYQKIKKKLKKVSVSDDDIDKVIENLRQRMAEKVEVDRAAKDSDEVWIDFEGRDLKGKEVAGASGKDYPLRLGSKTFIPGFEENLVGVKKGDEKDFTLTFPKDYGHKPLAGQKVKFAVKVRVIKEVKLPEVDKDFVAKIGPFKDEKGLRTDIKTQLMQQKTEEAQNQLRDEIVGELIEKSDITPPQSFVDEQIQNLKEDLKQNLAYRGITYQEFLEQSGKTEDQYTEKVIKPQAEIRVKIGILLSEVAEAENISVTEDEVDMQIQLLKGQAPAGSAEANLDSDQARRDVSNRLATQKTLDKLVGYATS